MLSQHKTKNLKQQNLVITFVKKSDPNNALSPNMCDASILNIGG